MSVKIREVGCLSEFKEIKQKVMEFEIQVIIFICCFKFGFYYRFFFLYYNNLNRFNEEKILEKIKKKYVIKKI